MTRLKKYPSIFIFGLLLFSSAVFAQTTRYVSDDLTIAMRSGTSDRHKILKFLNSGTPVKVLGVSEDGQYTHISIDDDREGWVKTEYLMDNKSARDQLVVANKKLDDSKQQIQTLNQTISDLKKQNQQLEEKYRQLMGEHQSLQTTLEQLRSTAANPIAIHEKNQQLEATIDEISAKNKSLLTENAKLNDNSLKEWFIIGAVVALGSLILGLIIPNIKWRKKDSWAGSF